MARRADGGDEVADVDARRPRWSPSERTAFVLLALLRMWAVVGLLGMIHPDEFFQSQEVMAHHVLTDDDNSACNLKVQLFLPWEYQLPTPNRSVLFPALVAGLPYKVMLWLGTKPTGYLLLVVPRMLLCVASFAIDLILYKIATKLRFKDPPRVVLCFASSWPTVIFLTRTFSNTCETLVLALCFAVLLLRDPHKRVLLGGLLHSQTLALGTLLAMGFFTRFTFVFFFFPIGLELVRSQDALYVDKTRKKNEDQNHVGSNVVKRVAATLFIVLQGLLSFALCSMVFIVIDTLYFRPEMRSLESWQSMGLDRHTSLLDKIVVAPLNNLVYNLQYDNLELHGVHARITHFAVNMPMLFGPLFVHFLVSLVTGNTPHGNTNMPKHQQFFGAFSVLFPLACISMAPHQEPRFLLPLLIPLQIFAASSLLKNRVRMALWVVFNFTLMVFFGVLHQGGVVPMLLSFSRNGGRNGMQDQEQQQTLSFPLSLSSCQFAASVAEDLKVHELMGDVPIVFYKTYMPPRFLLAGMKATSNFQVVDLAGGSANDISTQLQRIQETIADSSSSSSSPRRYQVFLVAPASVSVDLIVKSAFVSASAKVGSCSPHISTEDLALDKPLALELHLLELTKKSE